jgi:hypothetical protein
MPRPSPQTRYATDSSCLLHPQNNTVGEPDNKSVDPNDIRVARLAGCTCRFIRDVSGDAVAHILKHDMGIAFTFGKSFCVMRNIFDVVAIYNYVLPGSIQCSLSLRTVFAGKDVP